MSAFPCKKAVFPKNFYFFGSLLLVAINEKHMIFTTILRKTCDIYRSFGKKGPPPPKKTTRNFSSFPVQKRRFWGLPISIDGDPPGRVVAKFLHAPGQSIKYFMSDPSFRSFREVQLSLGSGAMKLCFALLGTNYTSGKSTPSPGRLGQNRRVEEVLCVSTVVLMTCFKCAQMSVRKRAHWEEPPRVQLPPL